MKKILYLVLIGAMFASCEKNEFDRCNVCDGMSLGPSLRKNFVNMNSADGESIESKIANMKKNTKNKPFF